jgi:hypothetical protein
MRSSCAVASSVDVGACARPVDGWPVFCGTCAHQPGASTHPLCAKPPYQGDDGLPSATVPLAHAVVPACRVDPAQTRPHHGAHTRRVAHKRCQHRLDPTTHPPTHTHTHSPISLEELSTAIHTPYLGGHGTSCTLAMGTGRSTRGTVAICAPQMKCAGKVSRHHLHTHTHTQKHTRTETHTHSGRSVRQCNKRDKDEAGGGVHARLMG